MSGRTRKSNRYVKRGMCQAAWAASHTRKTYLSAFYRRIQVRKGAPKAVMALAHHLITVVYNVLARGEEYVELGADYDDQRNKPKVVSRLVSRLLRLGYDVELKPVVPHEPPPVAIPPESAGPSFTEPLAPSPVPDSPALSPKKRKGRPCKCAERGIPCKHGRVPTPHVVEQTRDLGVRFS